MTPSRRSPLARPGTIRWRPSEGATADGVQQLATLLRELSSWPQAGFAAEWWPGDYRLLKLTYRGAVDVSAEVVCRSSAGSMFTDVTIMAVVRSEGRTRALKRSEQSTLARQGFGLGPAGRAELVHLNTSDGALDLAQRIIRGVSDAFGVRGAVQLRYRSESGSRLDSMPVFQDIRVHEILALLEAAGFQGRLSEGNATPDTPTIMVAGETPFSIQMAEPSHEGFVTLRLEARLADSGSPAVVDVLNRSWWVGAAFLDDTGVVIRQQITVTGGVSHAGLRDRLDEWVAGLSEARRLAAQ